MTGYFLRADGLLRGHPWATESPHMGRVLRDLTLFIILFGMLYGGVMGSFYGITGERLWQVIYSAVKVPLLLGATFLISLPSFFVLNTLLGLRADFSQALRALIATQAALAIILASLAPLTVFWYVSSTNYRVAVLFNGLMFAIASFSAQILLRHFYRPLIARKRQHRWMLWTWVVLYTFVGIQMAWFLRPFIGDIKLQVQFFRQEWWGNAYIVILDSLFKVFTQ